MTLFDELLTRADLWLQAIDADRDVVMSMIADTGAPSLQGWLDRLEWERTKHVALISRLQELRRENHPALIFPTRPTRTRKALTV